MPFKFFSWYLAKFWIESCWNQTKSWVVFPSGYTRYPSGGYNTSWHNIPEQGSQVQVWFHRSAPFKYCYTLDFYQYKYFEELSENSKIYQTITDTANIEIIIIVITVKIIIVIVNIIIIVPIKMTIIVNIIIIVLAKCPSSKCHLMKVITGQTLLLTVAP